MAGIEQQTPELTVHDPATGRVIGQVPELGPEAVAALARRGRAAQPAWQALGFAGRGRVLRRAQRWLLDHRDEVIATIRAETGKTYEDALVAELSYGTSAFGFWARNAPRWLADERVRTRMPTMLGKRLVVRHVPLGLIGVIGPWNYPLVNSFGDAIPALAAGNAVVLKPSELTPLTSLLLAHGLRESGVPDGVFQVATGGGATGAALVDEVDMVMFTGSEATGRRIAVRAAERLIPCALELGGKDPMIVLRDADVERAANAAVHYAMFNSGQTCISVERVYVEAPVYDEFVAKVVAKTKALRVGAGGPGSADMGAMASPAQLDVVERHVGDAVAKGARVLAGGGRLPGDGSWFAPTVLVDVDHTMACMREETFGPTLPIMRVRDAEEALALANDSRFGLGASVFGRDVRRAEQVARRLEAGAVCVNDALVNYTVLELPMGGVKKSGLGHRHGPEGIRKFCRSQSLLISRLHPPRELHMVPYAPWRTRLVARVLRTISR